MAQEHPGIGLLGASAIAATVQDPKAFRSGRDFAAWIGLVPREDSTGGKQTIRLFSAAAWTLSLLSSGLSWLTQ